MLEDGTANRFLTGRGKWRQIGKVWVFSTWGGSVLFIALLIFSNWPLYWLHITTEESPMGWFESVLLFLSGAAAGLMASLCYVHGDKRRELLLWSATAMGFMVLSVDEALGLHELFREHFLVQTGFKLLPWGAVGDFVMPLYALSGLFISFYLFRALSKYQGAKKYFLSGLFLALITVFIDSFEIVSLGLRQAVNTTEEVLESGAVLMFWSAMITAVFRKLEYGSRTETADVPAAANAAYELTAQKA